MNATERKTVGKMIHVYCRAKHGTSHTLCTSCEDLHEYTQRKLLHCKYRENKPTCQKCSTHCYRPEMKLKIKEVMRFSGPRIIFHNPVLAMIHFVKGFR